MGQTFTKLSSLFSSKSENTSTVVHDEEPSLSHHSEYRSTLVLPRYPFATPRSPLIRTKRTSSYYDGDFTRETKQLKTDFKFLSFPFLKDNFTIKFIRNSKVMFIMKGIPGSGKSFIVQAIRDLYKDITVCSADKFFMRNGLYEHDRDKLKDAHEYCQSEAAKAAKEDVHVIVIDNTNVKHWEMKYYLNLARTHSYIVVVVEPQTPWAMDADVLALKNVHDVPKQVLINKIESYQPVQPIYYGWFLNDVDSVKIRSVGWSWFEQALEIKDFMEEFLQAFHVTCREDVLRMFSQEYSSDGGSRMLHATSKFTARGKAAGAKEYMDKQLVKNSMGKGFKLCVIGFVITTRTIGARLELTLDQLELWSADEEPLPTHNGFDASRVQHHHRTNNSNCDQQKKGQVRFSNDDYTSVCVPTVIEVENSHNENRFHPTSGRGSGAHLTLACAPGVRPVTTKYDLILAVRREQQALECDTQKGGGGGGVALECDSTQKPTPACETWKEGGVGLECDTQKEGGVGLEHETQKGGVPLEHETQKEGVPLECDTQKEGGVGLECDTQKEGGVGLECDTQKGGVPLEHETQKGGVPLEHETQKEGVPFEHETQKGEGVGLECETEETEGLECDTEMVETYDMDGAVLRNYGEGIWVVYPRSKLLVTSLFSAYH